MTKLPVAWHKPNNLVNQAMAMPRSHLVDPDTGTVYYIQGWSPSIEVPREVTIVARLIPHLDPEPSESDQEQDASRDRTVAAGFSKHNTR